MMGEIVETYRLARDYVLERCMPFKRPILDVMLICNESYLIIELDDS